MIIVEVPREDRIVRARRSALPVSLDPAESGNTALRLTQIIAIEGQNVLVIIEEKSKIADIWI